MIKIIGLVGEKFSGKDSVAEYLKEKHQAFHIKFSFLLDEILDIFDLPHSRRNEVDLGLGIRAAFGKGILWEGVKKKFKNSAAPIFVINGIRFEDEFKQAKELGAKFIYITAPQDLRFQRYMQRKEKVDDGVLNFSGFQLQEQEATEVQIPDLGKKADFKIENTGSLEELYKKVDKIVINM